MKPSEWISRIRGTQASSSDVGESSPTTDVATGTDPLSKVAAKATRRGRGSTRGVEDALKEQEQARQLDQLFEGENWEDLAGLYFDVRYVTTGWDGFPLSDQQKKRLGVTMAASMRMLLRIDPAYIALIVFTTNMGGIIAAKEASYYSHLKAQAASKR